jgi:hypothetical protein
MTDEKKRERRPYEPPRLFSLGPNAAHAQAAPGCSPGGSPGSETCTVGSAAGVTKCQTGVSAATKCQTGTVAAGGDCRNGGVASSKCGTGSTPNP